MRRRDFIAGIAVSTAIPLAARAQQRAMPVVGFLDPRSPDAMVDRLRAFRLGLKEVGYVEGENVTIIYRFAEDQNDRLPELAAELVHQQVTLIATSGTTAAPAAKAATTTIPIAFVAAQDPVRLGLVASLARPGGNMTGINFFGGELVAKQLDLLHELLPRAVRVAVLVNPVDATNTASTLRDVEAAARAIGLQVRVLNASTSGEINAAFENVGRDRPDALTLGARQQSRAADVRFGSKADIDACPADVRFTPKSGHQTALAAPVTSQYSPRSAAPWPDVRRARSQPPERKRIMLL